MAGARGCFVDFGGCFIDNGPVESFMRWALTGSFEHSNRELLALSICGNMSIFVVHKGSQEVPAGPRSVPGGSQGVPEASLGGLRDVPGVPGAHVGVPGASQGSQGRAQGVPGIPGAPARDVPGMFP